MDVAAASLPLVAVPMKLSQTVSMPGEFVIDVERVSFQRGYRFQAAATEEFIFGTAFPAILDTGTAAIHLPSPLADTFERIYGCKTDKHGVFICPCDMGPQRGSGIYFYFGAQPIYVPWDQLADDPQGDEMCYTWVIKSHSHVANLGVAFLRHAYIVHHIVSFHLHTQSC
jgi:Eukaryotic aspartyl protease